MAARDMMMTSHLDNLANMHSKQPVPDWQKVKKHKCCLHALKYILYTWSSDVCSNVLKNTTLMQLVNMQALT